LQQEREKLSRAVAVEEAARQALARFREERENARQTIRRDATIEGAELRALSAYLLGSEPRERAIAQRLANVSRLVGEQRQRTLEAERRVRLIEKLEERQFAEWSLEADRQ